MEMSQPSLQCQKTILLHNDLQGTAAGFDLESVFRVRYSAKQICEVIVPGRYITLAFVFVPHTSILFSHRRDILSAKLLATRRKFRICFCVVETPTALHFNQIMALKAKFVNLFPMVITTQSLNDAAKYIQVMQKVFTQDRENSRKKRMHTLEDTILTEANVISILDGIPDICLSNQDRFLLRDVFGSIRSISQVSKEYVLRNSPVTVQTARAINNFFR